MGETSGTEDLPLALTCVICRDLYEKPYFAADGYSYCRDCIATWEEENDGDWASPHTNVVIRHKALLVGDFEKACAVLDFKQSRVRQLLSGENFHERASALAVYHDDKPVITASQARELLDDFIASPRLHKDLDTPSTAVYCLLDCCVFFDMMDRFVQLPQNCIRHLFACERHAPAVPFVRIGALEQIATALVAAGRSLEEWKDRHAAIARDCVEHLDWRYGHGDSVTVSRGGDFDGIYYRDPYHDEKQSLQYVQHESDGTRRELVVPLLLSAYQGLREKPQECKLSTYEEGGLRGVAYFTSECTDQVWKGARRWAGRKCRLAFPDYDPLEADCLHLVAPSETLSVFERYPTFLPHHFCHDAAGAFQVPAVHRASRWHDLRVTLYDAALRACVATTRSRKRKWASGRETVDASSRSTSSY